MKYREIGDVPYDVWLKELQRVGSPLLPYSQAMYDALMGHTALALAQMWQESQYETDRDLLRFTDYNPFNMKQWPEDYRTWAEMGITGTKPTGVGGPDYLTFESPIRAAQEWRRRVIDDPRYKGGVYNANMTLAEYIETFAPADEQHPTTGEDNSSYPANVVTMLKRYGVWKEEQPVVAFVKHTFPKLPNPVYLPDFVKVEVKIIPDGTPGWSSGQFVDPKNFTSTTWHDTDNMTSTARSEWKWAADGGRAEIGSNGSYNGIIGANLLIIAQEFNELVGHAANHQGNVTSYAFEQAELGTEAKFRASWDTGMWVHAGVLQSMGTTGTDSMYQHNFWKNTATGKHKDCPKQIRKRNLWAETERTVDARIAEITKFINGGAIPKPPTPEVPPLAAFLFGKVGTYSFNPNGPVSKLWLKNGNETGSFPRLIDVQEGKPKYFVFSDGSVIVDNAGKLDYLLKV